MPTSPRRVDVKAFVAMTGSGHILFQSDDPEEVVDWMFANSASYLSQIFLFCS